MSSIDNPKLFDYLKVAEFERGLDDITAQYRNVYPLTCVIRNSVHIQYADNSTYNINFDVFNDESAGFKALHEQSRIIAGGQIFVIQNYTKKINGVATASITATQLVNADFQRLNQPRMYHYKSQEDKQGDSNSAQNISYLTLQELLHWFFSGIDNMGFRYALHGHFPRRPIKNVGHWSGKQLLTQITTTWPGSVIIGWGHTIHFYGYQEKRDKNGNLQNVRDIDTGLRFDAMYDTKDIEISRDTTSMMNAIEVKSATYSVKNNSSNDDSDQSDNGEEFVYQDRPYFPNFIATSSKSIKKYGLYASQDVLDDGFTDKAAAMAAAREKMVLEPIIKVTATIDHPGKTESQPIPGHRYTIGIQQENEAHHVILRGFDWYPFDPAKGARLTLNNVDPGIIDNLRSTIVHDVELSPTITTFKALEDNTEDAGDGGDTWDEAQDVTDNQDSDDDTDITDTSNDDSDSSIPTDDTDDDTDRPDDDGGPNSNTLKSIKAYLPISDKGTNAHISRFGGITLNRKNNKFNIRVTDDEHLKKLRDGTWTSSDADNDKWRHLFMIDYNHSDWRGLAGHEQRRKFYQTADYYLGQTTISKSGLHATTAANITFRTLMKDSDYNDDGTIKHPTFWDPVHKEYNYQDWRGGPGQLADVYVGVLHHRGLVAMSKLSEKKNVKPLSKKKALNTVLNTDIAEYSYKDDKRHEKQASVIIDDVNKKPQWNTPRAFRTKRGDERDDSTQIGYLIKSVQALQDQIDDLKKENKELKEQLTNNKK